MKIRALFVGILVPILLKLLTNLYPYNQMTEIWQYDNVQTKTNKPRSTAAISSKRDKKRKQLQLIGEISLRIRHIRPYISRT